MLKPKKVNNYTPRDYSYRAPSSNKEESSAPKNRTASSTSNWRDSNDYRKQYFDRNNGIGGRFFICSQCFKPMFSKKEIQVDHIIPPSRLVIGKGRRWSIDFLAKALNKSYNCAAICPDCNRRKSDKLGSVVIRGYFMKSLEVTAGVLSAVVTLPVMLLAYALHYTGKLIGK